MNYSEAFEERAAILQHEGGLSREDSERIAFGCAIDAMKARLHRVENDKVARQGRARGSA